MIKRIIRQKNKRGNLVYLSPYVLMSKKLSFFYLRASPLCSPPSEGIEGGYPLQISSAGWALAVRHTRQPMQRVTSRATLTKMVGQSHRGIST